jgi:predicted phage tail protein
MSQTETLLLFVLGFCVALLLVMLFGRAIWVAIGRWSGWRQKRGLPKMILDLQAERDSLRAEKAMLAKRVESAAADLKMRMAETMAESARNRNRVLDLTANLKTAQATIEALNVKNSGLGSQIEALKLQIEDNVRAINDAWQRATHHNSETEREKIVVAELNREIESKQQRINNFENEMRALREIIAMFVPAKGADMNIDELRHAATPGGAAGQSGFSEAALVLEPLGTEKIQPANPFLPADGQMAQSTTALAHDNDEIHSVPTTMQTNGAMASTAETEAPTELEKGISNVLSLAEKVRKLQRNMKN